MRGMSCLLTASELLPGNIQGGSHTPAGWAGSISIDQEIKNFLQSRPETRTRFGSLEFGVAVPDRADPWTRMCYAGANQPIAPVDNPYDMFAKLYGRMKDKESLVSVLDDVQDDLKRVSAKLSARDKALLEQHLTGQHHTVGGRAVYLPAPLAQSHRTQRVMQRERVAGRALFAIGRHHMQLAQWFAGLLQDREALGENSVVVTEENAHE